MAIYESHIYATRRTDHSAKESSCILCASESKVNWVLWACQQAASILVRDHFRSGHDWHLSLTWGWTIECKPVLQDYILVSGSLSSKDSTFNWGACNPSFYHECMSNDNHIKYKPSHHQFQWWGEQQQQCKNPKQPVNTPNGIVCILVAHPFRKA